MFERIEREHGVDILVNNAAVIHDEMMGRTKFWEEPLTVLDTSTSEYAALVATVYAALSWSRAVRASWYSPRPQDRSTTRLGRVALYYRTMLGI